MRIKKQILGKIVVLAIVVIVLVFGSCPEDQNNNNNKNNNGKDFEIAGTYNFTHTSVVHTWVFNTDKTFKISWVRQSERNYTGTWSVSGNEITLQLDTVMGVSSPSEKFTASRSGKEVTLTLKGNAATSTTFAIFSMAATSLTLTEAEGSSGGSETVLGSGYFNDFTYEYTATTVTITGYIGSGGAVNIPSTIDGKPVVSIGDEAFCDYINYSFIGKGLTSVNIPNSVTTIGRSAFANNKLTSVSIPSSVTTIEAGVFRDNQLTSITIPNSVTTIGGDGYVYGGGAFEGNQLTSVNIPNSVTTIGAWAFCDNKPLASVTIGNRVTTIERGAFMGTDSLSSITIGANVKLERIEEDYQKDPIYAESISSSSWDSFPGAFDRIYFNGGKQAGTYTRTYNNYSGYSDWSKN